MDLTLSSQERLDLTKLLQTSDAENNTEHIRKIRHSSDIFDNLLKLQKLKKINLGEKTDEFKEQCIIECSFLYNNYTDIFNKIYNDELDLNIFARLLFVLKNIEDGKLEQHEGGVIVGKLLKEMYIDSALRKSNNLDDKYNKTKNDLSGEDNIAIKPVSQDISWEEWKRRIC